MLRSAARQVFEGISMHFASFMLAWVGCDPIFDCPETEMGPRNSHLETLKENTDCR